MTVSVSVEVEIPDNELQWMVDCILDNVIEYDDTEDDSLYDIFDEEFGELFDRARYYCDTTEEIKYRTYSDVKNTVFKMVQDELERRRG